MKLFLDANVLFTAAHNPEGKSAIIIDLGSEGHWSVVTCSLALEEANRNLLATLPAYLDRLAELSKTIELVPTIFEGHCPVFLPEKDRPILVSAFEARCSHLLTGDLKHFGKYMSRSKETCGIHIITVAGFLQNM